MPGTAASGRIMKAEVVAAQHAEGERPRAGEHVEERLLLRRVALERADVPVRDHERAAAVEPHLADAALAIEHEAAMAAGVAADLASGKPLVELTLAGEGVDPVGEWDRLAGKLGHLGLPPPPLYAPRQRSPAWAAALTPDRERLYPTYCIDSLNNARGGEWAR